MGLKSIIFLGLKGEMYSLSKEINRFSSLSQENFTLQKKLQKAENFENSFARVDKYADEIKVKDNIIGGYDVTKPDYFRFQFMKHHTNTYKAFFILIIYYRKS